MSGMSQHGSQSGNKVKGSKFIVSNSQVAKGSNKFSTVFTELSIPNEWVKLGSYCCSFLFPFQISYNGGHCDGLTNDDDVSRFSVREFDGSRRFNLQSLPSNVQMTKAPVASIDGAVVVQTLQMIVPMVMYV